MLKRLDRPTFLELAKIKPRVAVYREFSCDDLTPSICFHLLKQREQGAALLESAVHDQDRGRYSLLAFHPVAQFQVANSKCTFTTEAGLKKEGGKVLEELRSCLELMRCAPDPKLPPLVGGAVGFFSYDAIRLFEEIPDRHQNSVPEVFFLFHKLHIAFDHIQGRMIISLVIDVGSDPEKDYEEAMGEIDQIYESLSQSPKIEKKGRLSSAPFQEDCDDAAFCQKVIRAKEYIRQGDAFQIVISRKFYKPFTGSAFDVYRALRLSNPSPFMFYLETDAFAVAGASPERLIKVENGITRMTPIAGTRLRIPGQEEETERELLADPKEEAEHMMLVDLGRNDLGATAEPGSVCVKELKQVRRFAHVLHLVTLLEAKLREGLDALDAFKAVFPAGTLSGAPKIRAMEIIDELEESRRGIYGGAICSIDNKGDFDSCIAIRAAYFQDGQVSVRAGAGVVLDSEPEKEADETRHKAKGILQAIQMVEEGVL
jgi:anthranilate synthase component 1